MASRGLDPRRTRRLQLRLGEGQGWRCCHCGVRLRLLEQPRTTGRRATIEHAVPRARGGSNRWENLALACGPCNRRRGDVQEGWLGRLLRQPDWAAVLLRPGRAPAGRG